MPAAKLAYVAYNYPVLTQTFTLREVRALRERGLDVRVYACRAGDQADRDPVAAEERARTTYLAATAACGALARFLVARPPRFFATLARCLGGRYADDAVRCRLRAVFHFLLGVDLAGRLRREGGIDRVHAQFVDAGSTVGYVAARLLDVPFSFTNHTAYNPYQLPAKAHAADVIVSISEFDRQRVVQACGQAVAEKVVVSRVGIRLEDWTDVKREPEPGRILVVGALRDKKGHDVLLRAAARLEGTVRVRIAGGGDNRELRQLAAELGVRAEFLGPVAPDTVRDELTRAAVFALPCRVAGNGDLDGIPVVLMEAMAAGVPVVSTRLSGVPELIEHGRSGLLAEPGDVATLATALGELLRDPARARTLATAGRSRVAALHDLRITSAHLAGCLSGEAA